MTRTQRLLELLQILRAHRYPVTALTLSESLKISVRTVYRDIKTLQHQGVCIEEVPGSDMLLILIIIYHHWYSLHRRLMLLHLVLTGCINIPTLTLKKTQKKPLQNSTQLFLMD